MTTENLTPNVLLAILKKNGYETTKASIARYMQDGLVMRPLQRKKRIENEERAYYHPLVIIEIMTAILLFRGDFLEYRSRRRIARLTDRDIFFGRLNCYLYLFDTNHNIYIDEFYTSIDRYMFDNFNEPQKLYMNKNDINKYFEHFNYFFDDSLKLERYKCLGKAYKSFAANIYITTFEYLYEKHQKILSNTDSYIRNLDLR